MDNLKINYIAFADDIVVLSETDEGLQHSIWKLDQYFSKWGLSINTSKTKVVIFNKPFKKNQKSFRTRTDTLETCKQFCYLGVNITSTGSFHAATENLYKKAIRSLYSIYGFINLHSGKVTPSLMLKLFSILVKPIITYACEVWGYECFKQSSVVRTFINKFYRNLLGVPPYTSTVATHLELGVTPVDTEIKIAMIKYWFRLVQLPDNRLVSHCYKTLYKSNISDKWMTSVRNILCDSGLPYLWDTQLSVPTSDPARTKALLHCVCRSIKDQQLQASFEKMNSESRLKYYKLYKTSQQTSEHLKTMRQRPLYSILSKTRLGVLKLAIETGRHTKRNQKIPVGQRTCPVCTHAVIEDEVHFMFECDGYTANRANFIDKCKQLCHNFDNMTNTDKFITVINSKIPPIMEITANYITDIFNIRIHALEKTSAETSKGWFTNWMSSWS